VTHLGQRLSALIDGELDGSEREHVLVHMARCGSCRDEVAALRMLKRRMNALGEAAAGAGLTGRLMSLSELLGLDETRMSQAETLWPPPAPAGGWPEREQGHGDADSGRAGRPDQRAGRYFLAGSLAVFLAGLGTAAFIVGGEPQAAQAPAPPVTPSVDVLMMRSGTVDQLPGGGPVSLRSQPELRPSPVGASSLPRLP
jgi:anti-sigma factor RsiW